MKLGRLSRTGFAVLCASSLLSACRIEPQAQESEFDPEGTTVAQILAADLRNPALSRALNARLAKLQEETISPVDELVEAGFRNVPNSGDCERMRYEGPSQQRLGEDDTLRILWADCAVENGRQTKLVVNFGAAD